MDLARLDELERLLAEVMEGDWLARQLEAWPERVDDDKTTNMRFLMNTAAAAVRYYARNWQRVVDGGLWKALAQRCAADPKLAKRLVMVSEDDVRAVLAAITESDGQAVISVEGDR